MRHFAWKCFDAKPNRLVTFTVANAIWRSPRDAFEGTKRKITQAATRLRREFGEFEYFKVLEVTKKGWPHYHLVVRSPYISQRHLSNLWDELTGAHIVDVRKLKATKDVYFYVMKYLAKQKYIPWTNRRVSWSKRFFVKTPFDTSKGLELVDVSMQSEHPTVTIENNYRNVTLTAYSRDCWLIEEGKGHEIGIPIEELRRKGRGSRRSSPRPNGPFR